MILGLVAAATAAGAVVGLVAAIVVAPVGPLLDGLGFTTRPVVTVLVAVGLGLDLLALATGGPKPLAVGRQVPREWTRLLDPTTVAVLFGARLGVGPLTILSTWGWWSATVASAVLGVGPAIATGAAFGSVRLIVTVGTSLVARRGDDGGWFRRLRSVRRPSWLALDALGLVAVAVSLGACSIGPGPTSDQALTPGSTSARGGTTAAADGSGGPVDWANGIGHDRGPLADDGSAADADALATRSITPVELEDVVRAPTARPPLAPEDTTDLDQPSDPGALSAALVDEITAYEPIDDPTADRSLDLAAASGLQPDPVAERALLETRGFAGGWTRAFASPTNDVAIASVYQFADPAEAEFYLEDGLIQIGGYGGTFFDIEGLPGVRGFAQTTQDPGPDGNPEELMTIGAAFHHGARWYLIYLVGSPETATPDVLISAIDAQLARAR